MGALFSSGIAGVLCIFAASFFLSILFPTIFGCTVCELGARTKSASALLIMFAGSASSVFPVVNILMDGHAARCALVLPALCFAAIAVLAPGALPEVIAGAKVRKACFDPPR
jgi:FHS family L-fucose permease-like MFS transporter